MRSSTRGRFRIRWNIWWPAFAGFAAFIVTVLVGWAMSPQDIMETTDWQVLIVLCGGAPAGLGGAIVSLVLLLWAIKRQETEMTAKVLRDGSEVLASLRCAFCPGYRGSGLAWTVGGVLMLTTRMLWFLSSAAEFRERDERVPVRDIALARLCPVGISPHGLKVALFGDAPLYFMIPVFVGSERAQEMVNLINRMSEESAE